MMQAARTQVAQQNILEESVVRPTASSCFVIGVPRESQYHLLLPLLLSIKAARL